MANMNKYTHIEYSCQYKLTSLVQGPFISSGLRTFCHLCWHWISVRSVKKLATIFQFSVPQLSTTRLNFSSWDKMPLVPYKSMWYRWLSSYGICHVCADIIIAVSGPCNLWPLYLPILPTLKTSLQWHHSWYVQYTPNFKTASHLRPYFSGWTGKS